MSTRIYEAYKFNLKQLPDCLQILRTFRLSDQFTEFVYLHLNSVLPFIKDTLKLDSNNNRFIINNMYNKIKEELHYGKIVNFLDTDNDYILFIPYKKDCYFIPFLSNSDFKEIVLNKLKPINYTEFCYWNDNDSIQENINRRQWNKREKIWDTILTYMGTDFKEDGLIYSFNIKPNDYNYMDHIIRKKNEQNHS